MHISIHVYMGTLCRNSVSGYVHTLLILSVVLNVPVMWCVWVSLGLVEDAERVLLFLDRDSLLAKITLPFTAWLHKTSKKSFISYKVLVTLFVDLQ